MGTRSVVGGATVFVDLAFPVVGARLPTDHAYALYSALAAVLPDMHNGNLDAAVAPIAGQSVGDGLLALNERSTLRIRLPADQIAAALPFAGKRLKIAGHSVRAGVPRVYSLVPSPSLIARLVTIRGFTEPAPFLEAVRRHLEKMEIAGEPAIPLIASGPHAGEPRRRVLRIKDKRIVGFTLQVTGLTAEGSMTLQQVGIGGRRRMGCGFFVPLLKEAPQ